MLEQNPVPANLQREIALTSSAKKLLNGMETQMNLS